MEFVETASRTDPSPSQYNDIFGRASNYFEKLMRQDQFYHKPSEFESAEAVLDVLYETVHRFDDFIVGDQRLKTWLEFYVDMLFKVSATL